jgi:hypothetical protein
VINENRQDVTAFYMMGNLAPLRGKLPLSKILIAYKTNNV